MSGESQSDCPLWKSSSAHIAAVSDAQCRKRGEGLLCGLTTSVASSPFCLNTADLQPTSFVDGCSDTSVNLIEVLRYGMVKQIGVNLKPFLKTLTCQRNKTEPQIARLVPHTA